MQKQTDPTTTTETPTYRKTFEFNDGGRLKPSAEQALLVAILEADDEQAND